MSGKLKSLLSEIYSDLNGGVEYEDTVRQNIFGDNIDGIYSEFLDKLMGDFSDFGIGVLDEYRSTVLPIKTIQNIRKASSESLSYDKASTKDQGSSGTRETVEFTEHISESYENTFLRVMGMPNEKRLVGKSIFINENGKLIKAKEGSDFSFSAIFEKRDAASIDRALSLRSAKVLFMNEFGSELEIFSAEQQLDIFSTIESIRQEKDSAGENVNEKFLENKFFEILSNAESFANDKNEALSESIGRVSFGEQKDASLLSIFKDRVLGNNSDKNILNYSEYFMEDVALLFPPVQDSSVEYCLSEPEKIISKPFDIKNSYINRKKVKGSLLESIIRIRLDKVTGAKSAFKKDGLFSNLGEKSNNVEENNSDAFSFLEKIIIDRLNAAIENFAKVMFDLTETYIKSCRKAKRTISEVKSVEDDIKTEDLRPNNFPKVITEEEKKLLAFKYIDDSIMILLNKSSEYDESLGSFRSNSLEDGVSMDTLIKAITIPSTYAVEKLKEYEDSRDSLSSGRNSQKESAVKICQISGIGRGIGIVDLLCFALSFFTVPTSVLLGLLDDSQYKTFLKERDGSRFKRGDFVDSMNEFTERLHQSYALFSENIG